MTLHNLPLDSPNRPHTFPINPAAPDNLDPANQALLSHEPNHRLTEKNKQDMTHDITHAAKTLHERRQGRRDLEERKKKEEYMGEDSEQCEIHEASTTAPAKTISEQWREQQRLLEAKRGKLQQGQAQSSISTSTSTSTASVPNVSTPPTRSDYSIALPTIYNSRQRSTSVSRTDTENDAPPSLMIEWVEQELEELRLGTYSPAPAAASQTDENENKNENQSENENGIDEEGLPVDPSARSQALEQMKLKLQRRREQEEKDEYEDEDDEEQEDSLTFTAFDRKLRMKAAMRGIQSRKKRPSDGTASQNTELDSAELRFGPPIAGMQAVMEERARKKRERAAAMEALEEAEIEERTFNTSTVLSIKNPDPIRGMQVVMEERARRRRARAAAQESSTAHMKQSDSGSPKS